MIPAVAETYFRELREFMRGIGIPARLVDSAVYEQTTEFKKLYENARAIDELDGDLAVMGRPLPIAERCEALAARCMARMNANRAARNEGLQ
jgi:hypothetical protein